MPLLSAPAGAPEPARGTSTLDNVCCVGFVEGVSAAGVGVGCGAFAVAAAAAVLDGCGVDVAPGAAVAVACGIGVSVAAATAAAAATVTAPPVRVLAMSLLDGFSRLEPLRSTTVEPGAFAWKLAWARA